MDGPRAYGVTMVTTAARSVLVFVVLLAIVVPTATAATTKLFPTCKAMNKVYKHGIAKNFKVIKKATGLTGRPFVSLKLYTTYKSKDRDGDGVACEA